MSSFEEEEKTVKPTENDVLSEREPKDDVSWKDIKYQIWSSNIAFSFTINAGVNLAFSNLLLKDIDKNTSSWFASISALSTPIGSLLCGPLMDFIGRKGANLVIALPCVSAWLMLSFASKDQVLLLYFARFLGGISGGLSTSNLVYVSETTHKNYRSLFLSLLGVHFSFGILLTTVLNLFLNWNQSALFYAGFFSFFAIVIWIFTPESPLWLMNFRSDYNAAKKALKELYSNAEVFEEEWRNLKANTRSNINPVNIRRYRWLQSAVYKPVTSLLILILLQQLSGLYPMVFYAFDIFPQISPVMGEMLKKEAFVSFGVARFIASIICCSLSFKFGRRQLLMFSSSGMLVVSLVLILCRLIRNENANDTVENVKECMALISFILMVGIGAIGVMTIPWTLIVELLPTQKRGIGGSYLISYSYIILFVFTKVFPFTLDAIGVSFLFGFFAFISVLITIFVYFFIPETLGRTLNEIESFYSTKRIKDDTA